MFRNSAIPSFLLALISLLPKPAFAVRHLGFSQTDRFVACLETVFEKRVYPLFTAPDLKGIVCPDTREHLLEALRGEGLLVIESEDNVFVVPHRYLPEAYVLGRVKLERVKVRTSIVGGPTPGARALTPAEREVIGQQMLKESRALVTPAILQTIDQEGTAWVEISLSLEARHLSPGVESVIGILSGPKFSEGHRVIYGERKDSRFQVLWDSPGVGGRSFHHEYADVDGDGKEEILIGWEMLGNRLSTEFIVILSAQGDELTRQTCSGITEVVGDPSDSVCPIYGSQITLDEAKSGKRDILVKPDESERSSWPAPYRYTLVNGRYLLPKPALTSIEPAHVLTSSETSGETDTQIVLSGSNFLPISLVVFSPDEEPNNPAGAKQFNRSVVFTPKFIHPKLLKVNPFEGISRAPAKWKVKVVNRGAESNELTLTVTAPAAGELNAQGLALMGQQKYEQAVLEFAQASKIDPANAEFANNAGYAAYMQGSYQAAVSWLEQATRVDPSRAVAYLNLGDVYAKLKYNVGARQAYIKCLELAPNSKSASDVKAKLAALPSSP